MKKSILYSFWLAMIIVVGSHLYMLAYGLAPNQVLSHSIVNLVAGGLFAYAWYWR